MNCYTIESGKVTAGIAVEKFDLPGAGVEIDAIIVGEDGRGRELGVLPVDRNAVDRTPCPRRGELIDWTRHCPQCGSYLSEEPKDGVLRFRHPESGEVMQPLMVADVGQTRSGRPKLVRETSQAKAADFCIVAFRTRIGFRGGNCHGGDRTPEFTANLGGHHPFPGDELVRGVIAQGAAGRAGRGSQLVAVMPRGVVFRTGYSGRLYGAPGAHYYVFDGEKILAATWEEREVSDVF